jgi:hypothetical protein
MSGLQDETTRTDIRLEVQPQVERTAGKVDARRRRPPPASLIPVDVKLFKNGDSNKRKLV